MIPSNAFRFTQSVSRIVQHVNTISSLEQCQSRIESRVSRDHNDANDEYHQKQIEYDSLNEWLSVYHFSHARKTFTLNNALPHSNPLHKYDMTPTQNNYFQLNLKHVTNLEISLRDFEATRSAKNKDIYLQFSLSFINLDGNTVIGSTFLSEYLRLQPNENLRGRYTMNQPLLMYFYFHKSFTDIALQINFHAALCQKNSQISLVLDRISLGAILINLNDSSKPHYFIKTSLDSFFASQVSNAQPKQQTTKSDPYAQIDILSSPYEGFSILSTILLPFKIYTKGSKVSFAKNHSFPQDLDSIRFAHSLYTLSFQLNEIILPQSSIVTAKAKCQHLFNLIYSDVHKIQQIDIKEYRMVVSCHNGQKIISSSNCLLKKGRREREDQKKTKTNNYHKDSTKGNPYDSYHDKTIKDSTTNNQLILTTEGLINLDFVFDAEGAVIVCQVFCRIEVKFQSKSQHKKLSQSFVLPLSYCLKPVITLENDLKYIENLYPGELFGPKGIEAYIEQEKVKYEENKKSRMKSSKKILSHDKILLKAQTMTKSTIEFYVFKEKKDGSDRYHTTLSDQKDMSLSLSIVQKGHGNDINRLIMQKARIQRQRQKMQQKINKMNIEKSNKIPLLDPTSLKMQIYQQKLKKMRDSKYELKTTMNYLKNKIDQFERKNSVKNELIQDTLGQVFGLNQQKGGQVNIGQRLIGARGGMNLKRKEDQNEEQPEKYLRTIIPQNTSENGFGFNIGNILKLIKYLKQPRTIQIRISNLTNYDQSQEVKTFDIYCGFNELQKTTYRLASKQKGTKSSQQIKIRLSLPQLSPNLLMTILFSPLCLYFINSETQRIIGDSFIYLTELCNKIIKLQQNASSQDEIKLNPFNTFLYDRSQIAGKVHLALMISQNQYEVNAKQALMISQNQYEVKGKQPPVKSLSDQIESNFASNQKYEQQKRKLMRIENFKKKTSQISQQSAKLNSESIVKAEKQYSHFKLTEQLTGDKFSINYHSLSYNILKIPINNASTQTKNYQITVNDPDAVHLAQFSESYSDFQQLSYVSDPQYFAIPNEPIINLNNQAQQFSLEPHKNGTLVLEYSSRRKYFTPKLHEISIAHLTTSHSSKQELLKTYNHKRNINLTISSDQGVQKIINVSIHPQRDSNTINLSYHFEEQSEFFIPLPLCDLIAKDNIYFQHESVNLISQDQQIYLTGFTPELNKVILFDVFVFPKPQLFGKLAQQLQAKSNDDSFEEIQMMRKLIYSQKVITLSFEVWGCHKAKSFELRLFQPTDVLWQISKSHFNIANQQPMDNRSTYGHNISDFQPHIYLSSSNPITLGFRSTKFPEKILSSKNVALNFVANQEKTLVKSVISPNRIQSHTVVVEAQNQLNRNEVLCRYLISIHVPKPYFEHEFVFELEMDQLESALDQNQSKHTKTEDQLKPLRNSFLLDLSSLMHHLPEKNPSVIADFIEKNLKFHTTQNCLKLISIQQQTSLSVIKEFFLLKHHEQTAKKQQQKAELEQKKKNTTNKKQKDVIDKKQNKKNAHNFQPIIIKLTLELDTQLFAQKIKQATRQYESTQIKHMKLFEKALLNCLNIQTPFLSSVIGLSYQQKIIYCKINISQKIESDQMQLTLMKKLLQKSQINIKNTVQSQQQKQPIDIMKLFKL